MSLRTTRLAAIGLIIAAACGRTAERAGEPGEASAHAAPAEQSVAATADTTMFTVPESAWVAVDRPTIVAFYPVVSNDSLETDEGLAMTLDDLSFHLGSAIDSLVAAGFTVAYRGGDTLWIRIRSGPQRVVRTADSADVGYLFVDQLGRRAMVYGVRTAPDLIAYARAFRRTGRLPPEPPLTRAR